MKRKLVYGSLIFLLLGYVIWVNLPKSRYAPEVSAIVETRTKEWERFQSTYANDPTRNLYQDPGLKPLWARRSEMSKEPTAAEKALEEYNRCNPIYTGRGIDDLDAALAQENRTRADLAKARQAIQPLLRQLQAAVDKTEVFLVPSPRLTMISELPNFLRLRSLAQVAAFEAFLDRQEKAADRGAEKLLTILKLTRHLTSAPATLVQTMIASAMQAVVFQRSTSS